MKVKVYIRKDNWTPSHPWAADLEIDGKMLRGWQCGWRTKNALLREIHAIAPKAEVVQ